jgi:hypothetical protein
MNRRALLAAAAVIASAILVASGAPSSFAVAARPGDSVAAAPAGAPAIAEIKVTPLVAEGHVTASFAAPEAFTDDSREVVKSGVPLTFTYAVELRRPSAIWWDRTIGAATVAASVKFDNLTAIYQVTKQQDGRVTWSKSTAKEDEMRTWITAFDAVPIQVSEALENNADYYVRVRLDAHPHLRFSLWPWGRNDGSGRADFTFIR